MRRHPLKKRSGFTLVELLLSTAISAMLVIGVCGLSILNLSVTRLVEAKDGNTVTASMALSRIAYGYSAEIGLRQAKLRELKLTTNADGWKLEYEPGHYLEYSRVDKVIRNHTGKSYATRVTDSYVTLQPANRSVLIGVQITHPSRKGRPLVDTLETNISIRN